MPHGKHLCVRQRWSTRQERTQGLSTEWFWSHSTSWWLEIPRRIPVLGYKGADIQIVHNTIDSFSNSPWYGYAWFLLKQIPLKITLSLQNPCSSSPCLHNATCLNGFTDKRYICLCQAGFKGRKCEKKGDQKLRINLNKCQVYLHACLLSPSMNLLLWHVSWYAALFFFFFVVFCFVFFFLVFSLFLLFPTFNVRGLYPCKKFCMVD